MMGRIVYEVARAVSDTANEKIAECVEEWEEEEETGLHLRSSLLLALVANEVERGTTKEELVSYLETIYDVVNHPTSKS